jgi:hypothetical protein
MLVSLQFEKVFKLIMITTHDLKLEIYLKTLKQL